MSVISAADAVPTDAAMAKELASSAFSQCDCLLFCPVACAEAFIGRSFLSALMIAERAASASLGRSTQDCVLVSDDVSELEDGWSVPQEASGWADRSEWKRRRSDQRSAQPRLDALVRAIRPTY